MKLLLSVIIEVIIGVSLAGVVLAVAVPMLHSANLLGANDLTSTIVIVGVLGVAVAIALFRPGSAIHRHIRH
jgi:hypothetical protein